MELLMKRAFTLPVGGRIMGLLRGLVFMVLHAGGRTIGLLKGLVVALLPEGGRIMGLLRGLVFIMLHAGGRTMGLWRGLVVTLRPEGGRIRKKGRQSRGRRRGMQRAIRSNACSRIAVLLWLLFRCHVEERRASRITLSISDTKSDV